MVNFREFFEKSTIFNEHPVVGGRGRKDIKESGGKAWVRRGGG